MASYAGRDTSGVPHYIERPFTAEEREPLRGWFGIERRGFRSVEELLEAARTGSQWPRAGPTLVP